MKLVSTVVSSQPYLQKRHKFVKVTSQRQSCVYHKIVIYVLHQLYLLIVFLILCPPCNSPASLSSELAALSVLSSTLSMLSRRLHPNANIGGYEFTLVHWGSTSKIACFKCAAVCEWLAIGDNDAVLDDNNFSHCGTVSNMVPTVPKATPVSAAEQTAYLIEWASS